jgi:hypothetical protein
VLQVRFGQAWDRWYCRGSKRRWVRLVPAPNLYGLFPVKSVRKLVQDIIYLANCYLTFCFAWQIHKNLFDGVGFPLKSTNRETKDKVSRWKSLSVSQIEGHQSNKGPSRKLTTRVKVYPCSSILWVVPRQGIRQTEKLWTEKTHDLNQDFLPQQL